MSIVTETMNSKHKPPINSKELKGAFTLSLAGIGFVLILGVIVEIHPLITISIPIVIMASYMMWFHSRSQTSAFLDQYADSLYYMGFLSTIGSLVVSFMPFVIGRETVQAGEVLARFGVAELTTLMGLGARVLYTQFRITAEHAEAEANASLSDATRRFTLEVEMSVDAVRDLRARISAELEAGLADFQASKAKQTKQLEQELEQNAGMLRQLRATVASEIELTVSELATARSKMVTTFQGATEAATREFELRKQDLVRTMTDSGEAFADSRAELKRFSTQVGRLATQLEGHHGRLSDAATSIGQAAERIGELVSGLRPVPELAPHLNSFVGGVAALGPQLKQTTEQLANTVQLLAQSAAESSGLKTQLQQERSSIAGLRSQIEGEYKAAADAQQEMSKALVRSGQLLVGAFQELMTAAAQRAAAKHSKPR